MITTTVLVILGALLALVLWKMFRTPGARRVAAPAQPAPALPSGPDADLWNARKGDVVSIHGAAEDYADLDFTIDRRSAYEAASGRWIDLSGEFRGRRVYLEVRRWPDPELLGILDGRKLTIVDVNVTEDRLADMDARQDPSAFLEFEGKRWRYESSRELSYFEDERAQSEGLYRWIFREEGGPRVLCIEKWEGEPFDVRVAQRLKPEDITVYRATVE